MFPGCKIWDLRILSVKRMTNMRYSHRLLNSECEVIVALGAHSAVRRRHHDQIPHWRVSARWLHWQGKISIRSHECMVCCGLGPPTCPTVRSVFEQIVIVHQVCFEPYVKQKFQMISFLYKKLNQTQQNYISFLYKKMFKKEDLSTYQLDIPSDK